jgi:hypothetical protein
MALIPYLLIVLFSLTCPPPTSSYAAQNSTEFSSFESDMDGWTVKATDLRIGDGEIAWSISRSQDLARDGQTSLKLFMFNINDSGKIWIEKPFAVDPNRMYQVTVQYAFSTRDYGQGNLFTIITGALKKPAGGGNDLVPAMKDETGNGSETNVGYQWLDKTYDFAVMTGPEGVLNIVIGVWGTYEAPRTYYVDSVSVTLTEMPESTEFFSFENDMDGWIPKSADAALGSGVIDWSVMPATRIWEDGETSLKFDLDNLNGRSKIWIERAFAIEPKKKYKVQVDYAFHSDDCGDTPRFRIITGAFRKSPQTGDDLLPAFQEKTTSVGCTWGWLHKSYRFTVKTKKSEFLYIAIGIWGTQTAHRAYNFDSVAVTLAKK